MTEFQTIMLTRLRLEFDVDTTPADVLEGAALDAWIELAEDDLFERLTEEPTTSDKRSNTAAALMAFARKEITTAELKEATRQTNVETKKMHARVKALKKGAPNV